ncbi:MAG: AEC family transporter [Verrucomicrobiota bacterium]
MQNFWIILQAVLPVFIVIAAGGYLQRKGSFSPDLDRAMFKIVLNVFMPCFILDSILGNEALRIPQNIIVAPLIGFGLSALGAVIGLWFAPLIGLRERPSRRSFAFAISIFNYGYMAIPLAQSIFGKETLGMLFVFNLGVEIALWTLGALLLSRQSLLHGFRQINYSVIIAIIAGVILNFSHAQEWLPLFLQKTIHYLGTPANPLAILLIGAAFAASLQSFSFREGWKTIAGGIGMRNIFLPFLFLLVAKYVPMDPELRRVLVLQSAMPAALYPIVLIKHYHGDALTGLRVSLPSTLFGLLSIPLILRFGMSWIFG